MKTTARSNRLRSAVRVAPALLLAVVFLLIGLLAVISPDVPESALVENTIVGATLILTAAALIAAVRWPLIGGGFTCASALLFGVVFNAFGLSTLLLPWRRAGQSPFFSIAMILVLLLGVASVIEGRRRQQKAGHAAAIPGRTK